MTGKVGDWGKARLFLSKAPRQLDTAFRRALRQEAHMLRGEIVKGITNQAPGGKAFKPLSPATLAIRQAMGFRGTKALIRRADLRNGITVQEQREGFFVGVARNAVNKAGQKLANIAEINEFGSKPHIIQVTEKMRKFVMAAFTKAGIQGGGSGGFKRGFIINQIPARPFLRPVFDKYAGSAGERVKERVAKMLRLALFNF